MVILLRLICAPADIQAPIELLIYHRHARIQKVLSEGVQLWQFFFHHFFLVDEGRKDSYTTKSGPSLASQRFADRPMVA